MEDFGIAAGPVHEFRSRSVLMAEGARHTRLRTPLARFMGPTTVEAIRGVLRGILGDLMQGLSGVVPLHKTVSELIPARVYCHLAGAAAEHAPKVASLSERTLSLLSRDRSRAPIILAAYDELFEYLNNLIADKKANGVGSDMLSFLVKEQQDGKISSEELLDGATAMLEASSVNTTHQIGLAIWALLREKEIWVRIKQDPSLIGAAVVEGLRLYPRPGLVSRIATEDIELDGTVVPEGADVHIAIWSANRDPQRFERPGEFDLSRARNQPLTFSTGPHGCLGQSLARVEIEEVVRHFATHYPNSVVVDEGTEVEQVGGRWLVKSLAVDLRQ
jgi:cytochrome P450